MQSFILLSAVKMRAHIRGKFDKGAGGWRAEMEKLRGNTLQFQLSLLHCVCETKRSLTNTKNSGI